MSLGGRRYNTSGSLTAPASNTVPIANLTGGTTVRTALYDIVTGNGVAQPADNSVKLQIVRSSTTGSGASVLTPAPLDSTDPAAITLSQVGTFTTNPTLGVVLLQWAQNMRATFRWVAAPNSELLVPATANAGLALLNPAGGVGGSAFAVDYTFLLYE